MRAAELRSWRIRQRIRRLREDAEIGLHLGCGDVYIPGMTNCDPFSAIADEKFSADDLGEFTPESVDLIEHHHMIEHMSFAEAKLAVREWHRVLRPGGHLVVSCPDLSRVALRWLLRPGRRPDTAFMFYGPQDRDGMFHRSGYDRRQLRHLVASAGFRIDLSYSPWQPRTTPSQVLIAAKRSEGDR